MVIIKNINKLQFKNRIKSNGFTIVELLVVIVVIGILAAVTTVAYNGVRNKADLSAVKQVASSAQRTLLSDKSIAGTYPATLAEANEGRGIEQDGYLYTYTREGSGDSESFCLTVYLRDSQASVGDIRGVGDNYSCPGHQPPGPAQVIEYGEDVYPTANAVTPVPVSTIFQPDDVLVVLQTEHYIVGDAHVRINVTAEYSDFRRSYYIGARVMDITVVTGSTGSITMELVNDGSSVDMSYYVVRGVNNPNEFTLNSAGWREDPDNDANYKSGEFTRTLPSDSFRLGQLAILVIDGSVDRIEFPVNETPSDWTIDNSGSFIASAHVAATESSTTVSSDIRVPNSGYIAGGILVLGD